MGPYLNCQRDPGLSDFRSSCNGDRALGSEHTDISTSSILLVVTVFKQSMRGSRFCVKSYKVSVFFGRFCPKPKSLAGKREERKRQRKVHKQVMGGGNRKAGEEDLGFLAYKHHEYHESI